MAGCTHGVELEGDIDRKTDGGSHGVDLDGDVDRGDMQYCLLYTSPSPRDSGISRMPSSA